MMISCLIVTGIVAMILDLYDWIQKKIRHVAGRMLYESEVKTYKASMTASPYGSQFDRVQRFKNYLRKFDIEQWFEEKDDDASKLIKNEMEKERKNQDEWYETHYWFNGEWYYDPR